ncbi:MAG: hypothetical protein FWG75_05885 [Cystobacterineae bacterium]|nr:hypothetical protein [Cystobacterineae bacterium]
MKPFEKALSGFNHNVKHKGQLYHIQTEDSGKHNPTVTTLLFLGGNILASLKVSYAEHLDAEALPKRVRELMEAQHKQMLRNLLKGQYDKKNELDSKHWKVGQLDEQGPLEEHSPLDEHSAQTLKHQGLIPSEPPPSPAHVASFIEVDEATEANVAPLAQQRYPSRPFLELAQEQALATPSFEDEEAGTIFGEDLLSGKRLDELILNYLFREKDKLD